MRLDVDDGLLVILSPGDELRREGHRNGFRRMISASYKCFDVVGVGDVLWT